MHKTAALIGLGAVGLFVVSRVAQAKGVAMTRPVPPSSPSTLDTLIADAQKGGAIAGIVTGSLAKLGIIGGAAVTPAVVAPVATIGIDAATAAALPGATAIEAAPTLEAAAASQTIGTDVVGEVAGSSLGDVAVAVALPAGIASLGYVLGWWGPKSCPPGVVCGANDYAKDGPCDPTGPNYDARACASGAADSGAASFVLDPEGNKVLTGGNVNLRTYQEAVDAGFGAGQY